MQKIPTLFIRDPETNLRFLTREVHPACHWVIAGLGVATRKFDGTCVMLDTDGRWWARREIKPGKKAPADFVALETDSETGKTVGWEPVEQSAFAKWHDQVLKHPLVGPGYFEPGTYELCGPKINGNPEGFENHVLVRHGREQLQNVPRDYDGLRAWLTVTFFEGIVWHHPDGRMAKIKRKDFPRRRAMAELHIDEPLDEGYWESLGMEGDQARKGDPFSSPPPGTGSNPFEGTGGPTGRSRYEPGWLKTHKGIEFIDVFVGEAPGSDDTHMLIYLYEAPTAPGQWAVGWSRPRTIQGGDFLHKGVAYDEAKALAESEAAALSVDAGTNADWRLDPAGIKQIALIQRIGLFDDGNDDERTLNKGQASDMLNVHFASRTLDPHFAPKESKP